MSETTSRVKNNALSFWVKLAYGSGDWSEASYGTLRQIFYAIFLTDVVGLDARLASFAALVGIIWDAINDPLVGILTDRMRSRWGRRRPFLLIFRHPFRRKFPPAVVGTSLAQPNRPGCDRDAGIHDQRYIRNPMRRPIFLPAPRVDSRLRRTDHLDQLPNLFQPTGIPGDCGGCPSDY